MKSLRDELQAVAQHPFRFQWIPFPNEDLTRASVLTLFQGDAFLKSRILITLRSSQLATHSGQVAFPGGGMDEVDRGNSTSTALRECREEIGIAENQIEALGELPEFPTATGNFRVTPILGRLLSADAHLILSPHEVVRAEWVEVAELRASRYLEVRQVRGVDLELPVFRWGEEKMWGLSAMIFDLILNRYDRLEA